MMTMLALIGVVALSAGCSKSKSEKVIDAMEEVVEKIESMAESDTITQDDRLDLAELQLEMARKAKDVEKEDFTEADQKEIQDLMLRMQKALAKIQQKHGG